MVCDKFSSSDLQAHSNFLQSRIFLQRGIEVTRFVVYCYLYCRIL